MRAIAYFCAQAIGRCRRHRRAAPKRRPALPAIFAVFGFVRTDSFQIILLSLRKLDHTVFYQTLYRYHSLVRFKFTNCLSTNRFFYSRKTGYTSVILPVGLLQLGIPLFMLSVLPTWENYEHMGDNWTGGLTEVLPKNEQMTQYKYVRYPFSFPYWLRA